MDRLFSFGIFAVIGVGVLTAGCSAAAPPTPTLPELTNQRFMNLQGYEIAFGCDGTTGIYREQVAYWSIAAVPNDVHCR